MSASIGSVTFPSMRSVTSRNCKTNAMFPFFSAFTVASSIAAKCSGLFKMRSYISVIGFFFGQPDGLPDSPGCHGRRRLASRLASDSLIFSVFPPIVSSASTSHHHRFELRGPVDHVCILAQSEKPRTLRGFVRSISRLSMPVGFEWFSEIELRKWDVWPVLSVIAPPLSRRYFRLCDSVCELLTPAVRRWPGHAPGCELLARPSPGRRASGFDLLLGKAHGLILRGPSQWHVLNAAPSDDYPVRAKLRQDGNRRGDDLHLEGDCGFEGGFHAVTHI